MVGWHGRTSAAARRRDGFSLSNLHHRDMRSIRACLMHCMAGRLAGGRKFRAMRMPSVDDARWMENEQSIDPAVRKSDVHAVSECYEKKIVASERAKGFLFLCLLSAELLRIFILCIQLRPFGPLSTLRGEFLVRLHSFGSCSAVTFRSVGVTCHIKHCVNVLLRR